jgi:DNA primase small subunit
VLSSSTKELKELGVKPSAAKKIGENKETQLGLISRGNWTSLEGAHEGIVKKTILEKAVVVDKGVTIDSSKLIRVPDSLHGDTGLLAKTVSLGELEKFEPEDAIAFGKEHGNARVKITLDSVLELGEDTVELKENDVLELPLFAVILLLCKGKAVLT